MKAQPGAVSAAQAEQLANEERTPQVLPSSARLHSQAMARRAGAVPVTEVAERAPAQSPEGMAAARQ
eukprot:4923945-Prymnesium_polylepis.1